MAGPTLLAWVARACVVLASACAFAFVAGGLWQAGAIITEVAEASSQPAAAARPPPPAPSVAASAAGAPSAARQPGPLPPAVKPAGAPAAQQRAAPDEALLSSMGSTARTATATVAFEEQAEASEKTIPVGLEAAADADEALVIGEPPPPDYPRIGCEDVFVYIVTVAEGAPRRSAASLGIGKRGPARFRVPGEKIGDWTVLAITDDWTGLNPDVWLEKDGAACKAELAGNPARVSVPLKPPVRKAKKKRKRKRKRRSRRR